MIVLILVVVDDCFNIGISFMKEVSWFTGLSLSNNLNEMYLPKAATA
jgi:hypothetical protein